MGGPVDETIRIVITYILTFLGGYFSPRYLTPKVRLVHWFPAYFTFQVPFTPPGGAAQVGTISTHALTIQNLGWRAATGVEIVHVSAPQFFQLHPVVNFNVTTTPNGQHVITIPSLARREWVTVQILSVGTLPALGGIKSAEGPSRQVNTTQNFVVSKQRQAVLIVLLLIGLGTVIGWLWRVAPSLATRLAGLFSH
jgi:hypothetical protein